ncbi:uncharacterized protein Z520_08121 [Fonsecaea multimorphosa CBS 102226]|uniref:HECT-type E3 ubiquitin transferase n=1 Tax=Fonsecaea multimorphosa CBS 102226 TaxID=1442371 RepID=A0A0D2KI83_9EURO|nr:uncharacterized protein Z520_08121 [Fonsecaea multimorphosa CBS 102226]KIX96343.1 hypothetical protein Z520_08121 [Fonsecaea multimorphosa CBS 102226]OAL22002.1 hypothetical protein AYO22_07599 [Fonsecaea multimorphosa]
MHFTKIGSKPVSLDEPTHEGSEKQPRVKASDLGFHAPDYVLDDIIPITDPKLLYSNIHAQRDRRLRLLIRRYTNQIQYGCRNVNCTTPTCLSFRKRNSTGPLRKYTELSARTLACQLVDDYNRHGKEPFSGLCQNEPVVPWYEDPALIKKRRNSHEKVGHLRQQENGHVPKPPGLAQQRTKDPSKPVPTMECAPRRFSQDGVVQAGRRLRDVDTSIADDVVDVLNCTIPPSNTEKEQLSEHEANGGLEQPSAAPAKQKDLASFTQTLFDLVPLRLLNWLPAKSNGHTTNVSRPAGPSGDQKQASVEDTPQDFPTSTERTDTFSEEETDEQECASTRPHHQQAYSLRTFTWVTLPWLRCVGPDDEGYQRKFVPFIKQSLVYCLSDPERLMNTVKNLQASYWNGLKKRPEQNGTGSEDRLDVNPRKESISPWPVISTSTRDDVQALLFSFAFIQKFEHRDLVMNSILNALQHAYYLPPWLQSRRPGKHSRSGSASCDLALFKRRQSSDGNSSYDPRFPDSAELGILSEVDKPLIPLEDSQITDLCFVALLSLATAIFHPPNASLFKGKDQFVRFARERNSGLAHSFWHVFKGRDLMLIREIIDVIDITEDWAVHRLLTALMNVVSHRLTVGKWAATLKSSGTSKANKTTVVESLIDRFDRDYLSGWGRFDNNSSWIGFAALELGRTVMLKDWDRSPVVQRAGPVGGALELLAGLYRARHQLNLDADWFHMPFIATTFDDMSMPSEWLSFRPDSRQMHLLSFSFLFQPHVLVKYFRAINIAIMKKSHEDATIVYNDIRQYMWAPAIPIYGAKEVLAHLRPHMARYFVLTIRRHDVLNDAIDQIWRRQRRELMRPLRVRLGKDEGEDGLDHGGVQQEFFRVVFGEALRPEYSMFTVDSTTRMAWFQPGSFEPLYRFEALGILMSMAIYNGITLPITMPLAFYRKLLGLKVKKLDHIADGWPELTKGLKALLEWSDGDVGEVIARTYEFSYELCGTTVTVDMQKVGRHDPWPPTKPRTSKKGKEKSKSTSFELPLEPALTPPPQPSPNMAPNLPNGSILSRTSSIEIKGISTPLSIDSDMLENNSGEEEAALVTNANREQYVKDYILWLTHKSIEPQYEAFARGFYTCLDRTALSIFNPESLKALIEGYPEIDIDELQMTATYDEYTPDSPTIVDFWHIVRSMSTMQHRQLLEFVTASDRVPVNGMQSVTFIVQKNGEEDDRLPSSSTCYGRLLLPQYSSRKVMEEKLTKAIENCVGFGTL